MRKDTIWNMLLIAAWLLGWIPLRNSRAQSRPPTEYEIKAAFLYEFARFVEWVPATASASDSFAICVLGVDPFGVLLDEAVKDKTTNGYKVIAKRIVGAKDAGDCRILFVSPSEDNRLPEILKVLEGRNILTVGEGNQFTRRGGMISFRTEESRVRLTINTSATDRAGLKVSSQLLKLASIQRSGDSGS